MSDKLKVLGSWFDCYDENNTSVLTAKQKAVKDYNEAGYAIDNDGSIREELVNFMTDKEGYPVDILWDKDRPYNIPDV